MNADEQSHRLLALLFDLGDTIMIEESEVKDAEGTTESADLIPGMADALRALRARGYSLALVADSRRHTPPNCRPTACISPILYTCILMISL